LRPTGTNVEHAQYGIAFGIEAVNLLLVLLSPEQPFGVQLIALRIVRLHDTGIVGQDCPDARGVEVDVGIGRLD
jgi:hypothetical protein